MNLELHDAIGNRDQAVSFSEVEANVRICTRTPMGNIGNASTDENIRWLQAATDAWLAFDLEEDMEKRNEPLRRRIHPDGSR